MRQNALKVSQSYSCSRMTHDGINKGPFMCKQYFNVVAGWWWGWGGGGGAIFNYLCIMLGILTNAVHPIF